MRRGKRLKRSKKEAKEGENVTLTIDAAIQEKIFNEMKTEAGSSARSILKQVKQSHL